MYNAFLNLTLWFPINILYDQITRITRIVRESNHIEDIDADVFMCDHDSHLLTRKYVMPLWISKLAMGQTESSLHKCWSSHAKAIACEGQYIVLAFDTKNEAGKNI